ncbi:hypothetical protein AVEN_247085-1 [Araneus ventricosus]|uniref:Jerky-like n=1 Tax=Araneus ventricosus TaxID=182803 RepID=A0A4Y2SX33_ARAVE|nr:hypothetical protein AVEN_247085-1 [Araneus ventricosus]
MVGSQGPTRGLTSSSVKPALRHKKYGCFISEIRCARLKVKESSEFEEYNQENIQNWLKCDTDDPSYHVLMEDEIVARVIDDQNPCIDEELSGNDCAEKGPSSKEAFYCLETAMRWLEQQEECDAIQLLSLKRARDLAARKT